jgi:hypothetical protein
MEAHNVHPKTLFYAKNIYFPGCLPDPVSVLALRRCRYGGICGDGHRRSADAMPAEDGGDFFYEDEAMEEVAFRADGELATENVLPQERLIIRTANLGLIVEDTEAAMAQITAMVEENGGWVVSSNVYQYREDTMSGNITVRVPSSGFNSAMEAMKGLAVEVQSESTSGQDVTEEFVDLSSRLENLEATADRVRGFLDETQDVEEALAVNAELSRLEGEIEVIKGRMQFLSQSASFSTITVDLTPDYVAQPIEVGGWRPEGVAKDAVEALVDTLQGLANFLIWVGIYLLPVGLLVLLPLYFVGRAVRRRWRRRGGDTSSQEK